MRQPHILPSFEQLAAVHRGAHPCLGCDDDAQFFDKETKEYFCAVCANEAWLDHHQIEGVCSIGEAITIWKRELFTDEELTALLRRSSRE